MTQSFTVNDYGMVADPMADGLALVVNGTAAADTITFERTNANKIKATRNGVVLGQTFNPTHIIAYGAGGVNLIAANANVTVPVVFTGGSGKDTLFGGSGNDVLLGRKGVDRLDGGAGRDLLAGGGDSDNLQGNTGEDIMIGGDYASDDFAVFGQIMTEWGNTSRSFTQRVARLRNGAEGLPALFATGRVIGDGRTDAISGGADNDWIYRDIAGGSNANVIDSVSDAAIGDRVDNITIQLG